MNMILDSCVLDYFRCCHSF